MSKTSKSDDHPGLFDVRCPTTIGFRLDDEHGKQLVKRAESLGVSVHELARHYVLLVLHEKDERTGIQKGMMALHQEMTELRKDVVVSTEALLTSAGKVSNANAKGWVRENFKIE
jgi:hypothetical protein